MFDPQTVTVTQIALGDHLGVTGNAQVALGPRLDTPARLVYGAYSFGDAPGAGGSGWLATLELELLQDIPSALSLDDVQLVALDGTPLASEVPGTLQVSTGYRVYLPLVLRVAP
jgi:hypothetical protein